MKKILLFFVSLLFAPFGHAALTYDISTPDDLMNLVVGQTVHFDLFLPGISDETWDDVAIFNARALSSDDALWETPFNVSFNPALAVSSSAAAGLVNWVHTDVPLTMLSDFVMSFDIVTAAPGTGTFSVAGADIFRVLGQDTILTLGDQIDFNIAATVPEPSVLGLLGIGVLGLLALRKRLEN